MLPVSPLSHAIALGLLGWFFIQMRRVDPQPGSPTALLVAAVLGAWALVTTWIAAQGLYLAHNDKLAIVAGIFILTTLTSQAMPNAAVTVLMAPIALNIAGDMSISPYALMMTVAIAASASFLSPVAHPANSLVMGPGGYRFSDFIRAGLPLTLIVFVLVLTVMPIFWPLTP